MNLHPIERIRERIGGEAFVFCIKALLLAVFLKAFLAYFFSLWGFFAFLFFPALFMGWLNYQSVVKEKPLLQLLLQSLTVFPVPRLQRDRDRALGVPWITYALILFMGLIFFGLQFNPDIPRDVWRKLSFFPEEPESLRVLAGSFTHMFLHGSVSHYLFNMFFLWSFGTALESRIGWRNTLMAFLLTGVLSAQFSFFINYFGLGAITSGIGSSGAIAGLIGVFAVRCYFQRMILPLPILGLLSVFFPLSVKIRLNALAVIAFFFMDDFILGARAMIYRSLTGDVDYWAHICGLLSGIAMGAGWRMADQARLERDRSLLMSSSERFHDLGKGLDAAHRLLERDPYDPEVHLHLARIRSGMIRTEAGARAYETAVEGFLKRDPERAVAAYLEYTRRYARGSLSPPSLERMARLLEQRGRLNEAARCLEVMLEDHDEVPADLRAKALFHLGRLLAELDFMNAAGARLRELLKNHPSSTWADPAGRLLGKLQKER
jgi:membrane associated rhomboid family serine protease